MPISWLKQLQSQLGILPPAATHWAMVHALATVCELLFLALWYHVAQACLLQYDVTTARILALSPTPDTDNNDDVPTTRKSVQTTGIVAECEGRIVVVYQTGRRHAGENIRRLWDVRESERDRVKLMNDALAANNPKSHHVAAGR